MGVGRYLAVLAVLMAGLLTRQVLVLVAALCFGLAVVVAPAWARSGLRAVSYRRRFQPARAFPGESVEVVTQVENDKLLPVSWLAIADENPAEAAWEHLRPAASPGARRQALHQVLALRWFQSVTRHYRVRLPRRGLYRFGPATLHTCDAFGLEEAVVVSPAVDQLIVYPRLIEPPRLALLWQRPEADRPWRGALWEDPTRLIGTRAYQPGDPWRRVHWQATARMGSLQIKLCEPAAGHGLALFLDMRTTPDHPDEGQGDRLEAAISLAASIFAAELAVRRPVALFANGHMEEWGAGPAQSLTTNPGQWPALLEGLARLLPTPVGDIAAVVGRELPRLPRGTQLLLITGHCAPGWVSALTSARARGYPVSVLWLGGGSAPVLPEDLGLQAVDWREVS